MSELPPRWGGLRGQIASIVAVAVLPLAGLIVYEFLANPALWGELLHPDDAAGVAAATGHCLAHGGSSLREYRIRHRATGDYRWLEDRITAERGEDGRVSRFFGIARDVTQRKLAEEALRKLTSELERRVAERTEQLELASRAKDSFPAAMSHEVRTPLAGMMGMLEVLALSPMDPEGRKALDVAIASARSLARIVDDILDWSKIEAGKLELSPAPTLVRQTVAGVAETYARLASAKGLAIRQRVDPALSPALVVDSLRLTQVLNNLVSNAIKFTARGEVEIGADLVERSPRLERVRFWVRDTGIGMDEAMCRRIFQSYVQGASDTTRRYGGTGLGLAICRRLAGLMGGEIDVRSTPGKGSVFSLTLALEPAAEAPDPQVEAPSLPLSTAGASAPRLLVVDDHPVNRELLVRQLALLGLRVVAADGAVAALQRWGEGGFDLVITDCHMPGMDGLDLARAIREREAAEARPRVPIVAWTANVMREEAERCREAGMDEVLTKPTPLARLREVLQRWLPAPPGDGLPIDPRALAELTAGDADAERTILVQFRTANDEDADTIRVAAAARDLAALTRAAHRIKGLARTVGANALAGAAEA